jgi:hypothetical protein
MATIVVTSKNKIRPRRLNRVIGHIPEGASQSFKNGHVVVLSAGKAVKGATDPAAGTVIGVAADDASGVTDAKGIIYAADENAEFIANVQDTGVLALANVGLSCGLVLDATNDVHRVDLADTTNLQVKITELVDAVGDVNGLVCFKFLNAARVPLAS